MRHTSEETLECHEKKRRRLRHLETFPCLPLTAAWSPAPLGLAHREAQMGRSIAESEDDSDQSSLELLWVLRC